MDGRKERLFRPGGVGLSSVEERQGVNAFLLLQPTRPPAPPVGGVYRPGGTAGTVFAPNREGGGGWNQEPCNNFH